MPSRDKINEIALKLASIDDLTRISGMKELRSTIYQITPENLTKISAALFYFYWHSDSQNQQEIDRNNIINLFDSINQENSFYFQTAFLESLVKLWESVDKNKVEKYLLLLKEFYFNVYKGFNAEEEYKKNMVQWNDFLSTCIIFNPKGFIKSSWRRSRTFIRFAKNKRRVSDLFCSEAIFTLQTLF